MEAGRDVGFFASGQVHSVEVPEGWNKRQFEALPDPIDSMTEYRFELENPTGWLLPPVRRIPSPNHDERPDDCIPEVVIIHAISLPAGRYGGGFVEDLFVNHLDPGAHPSFPEIARLQVSAHFLVGRSGELEQFVAVGKRAWHAGASRCLGRERVNDFSIGIELEGCDYESFTMNQYRCLAALLAALRHEWPQIGADRLFGHSDIAPGRKTDPGPCFDWTLLRTLM